MKEFGRYGNLAYLKSCQRRALLADLLKVINEHKLATVAARLTTADYQESFAGLFDCKVMSVYGFCFLLSLVLQSRAVQACGYSLPIPITLDDGNQYKQQIVEAHSFILDQFQKTEDFINVGYLTIYSDDRLAALQAANLVAWTVRRACTGKFIKIAEGIRTKRESNRIS